MALKNLKAHFKRLEVLFLLGLFRALATGADYRGEAGIPR